MDWNAKEIDALFINTPPHERAALASRTSRTSGVGMIEFPAPDLSQGFDNGNFGSKAPPWRILTPGLNIEYRCKRCSNYPLIMVGFGVFNAVDVSLNRVCIVPDCGEKLLLRNVRAYWLYGCRFEWDGVRAEDEERIYGSKTFPNNKWHRTRGDAINYYKLVLTAREL